MPLGNEDLSFGRTLINSSIEQGSVLEQSKSSHFQALDPFIQRLLELAIASQKLVDSDKDSLRFIGLTPSERTFVNEEFSVKNLNERGAWFVPENARLSGGAINTLHYLEHHPRFALSVAADDQSKVSMAQSSDHVLAWSLMIPMLNLITRPIRLRGQDADGLTSQELIDAFEKSKEGLACISESADYALQLIGPGSGWSGLGVPQRIERRRAYVRRIAGSLRKDAAQRTRLFLSRPLLDQYYAKAKNSTPTHRTVLKKDIQHLLVAYFGGSWFRFLDYLGEQPSTDEQIHTSLPERRLLITTSDKLEETAKRLNLPVSEIANVVSGFWNSESAISPVETRLGIMERYWHGVFSLHDERKEGMTGLWGLVAENERISWGDENPNLPIVQGLYNQLLSSDLIGDINANWAAITSVKRTEVRIDNSFPHNTLTDAIGAALRFWNNCSLTAWFISEGPYSRTDMEGLEHHQRRELAVLQEMGFPVNGRLFTDLISIEKHLGPPKDIARQGSSSNDDLGLGISITLSIGMGSCRGGYDRFRIAIKNHRDEWTTRYLKAYLSKRAEMEIGGFAEQFSKSIALKGKTPTLKSMAKTAVKPATHWFNGDVSLLYASIGEKLNEPIVYTRTLPEDATKMVHGAFVVLEKEFPNVTNTTESTDIWRRNWALRAIAMESIRFFEEKALKGYEPTLETFGVESIERYAKELGTTPEIAWSRMLRAFRSLG
jgi:hypothetical protein